MSRLLEKLKPFSVLYGIDAVLSGDFQNGFRGEIDKLCKASKDLASKRAPKHVRH